MGNKTSVEIRIAVGSIHLVGGFFVPTQSNSMVIFSHGSGSSRLSPRNRYVAGELNKKGIATLLIDLLTPAEDSIYENRFNIGLLTQRLLKVTEYIVSIPDFKNFKIGYFGASTGAASALMAAAKLNNRIGAVVSRGGRPDLAAASLNLVRCPTLLIVGSLDGPVIELNRGVYSVLTCDKRMVIVQGASHLFEEPGKLEEVARLAGNWFEINLQGKAVDVLDKRKNIEL